MVKNTGGKRLKTRGPLLNPSPDRERDAGSSTTKARSSFRMGSRQYSYRSPSRSPESSKREGNGNCSSKPDRLCSVDAASDFKISRRGRVNEKKQKTDCIPKLRDRRTNRSGSPTRSHDRSSRYSSRSSSHSYSSPEPRRKSVNKTRCKNDSSCSYKRRQRSRSADSSIHSKSNEDRSPAPLFSNESSKCGDSHLSQMTSTESSTTSSAAGNGNNSSDAEIHKREFLEQYISRLRSQIFYKDNKLYRLQHPRAPHKDPCDKDTLLQHAWDQHDSLYKKFQAIENELKSSKEEKLQLEKDVKKLEKDAELRVSEMNTKDSTIVRLTGQVGQMQSLKQLNEQLKGHYEKELRKKLELYQKQCADYVADSMRSYQVSYRCLQLQLLSLMDSQIAYAHHSHQIGFEMGINPAVAAMSHVKASSLLSSVENRSESTSIPSGIQIPHPYSAGKQSAPIPVREQAIFINPTSVPGVRCEPETASEAGAVNQIRITDSNVIEPLESLSTPADRYWFKIQPRPLMLKKPNQNQQRNVDESDHERVKQKLL